MKSKPMAAWAALLLGSVGLHRFYLYGSSDRWAWLHPWPTLVGLLALRQFADHGSYDSYATWGLPLLSLMLALGAFNAILIALTPDEKWNAKFNPNAAAPDSGWGAVLAAIAGLLVGGTALVSGIAFAAQRYFEISLGQ
jgi:Zn-dependent protease